MSSSAGARSRKQVFPQNDYSDDDDLLDDYDESYFHDPDTKQPRQSSKLPQNYTHANRTPSNPVTMTWLIQNYETGEGFSIPRNAVYSHYETHCHDEGQDLLNAASFGKLIRSVFLGLRTRRLGTRGNSQYHYNGIRIKADSKLNRVGAVHYKDGHRGPLKPDSSRSTKNRHSPYPSSKSYMNASPSSSECDLEDANGKMVVVDSPNPIAPNLPPHQPSVASAATPYAMYLGVGQVPVVSLQYDCMQTALGTMGLSVMHADMFLHKYRQHCQDILSLVLNLQLNEVEQCWRHFWQPKQNFEQISFSNQPDSNGLSDTQLYSLCTVPQIQQFVQQIDYQFYDVLLDVLMPNLLLTVPSDLLRLIRNFAKGLHGQLSFAMYGVPDVMQNIKLTVVKALSQTLVRQTTLCHVAQSARQLFNNQPLITEMAKDIEHVDFENVLQQAVWVCGCDRRLGLNLQTDFKDNLCKHQSLENWASWLEAVVDQVLAIHHNQPINKLERAAKSFLLKWSFCSAIVFRDLEVEMDVTTSRSFHLMKLLCDDYLFHLVQLRLARTQGMTVIQVAAQNDQPLLNNIMLDAGIKCEDILITPSTTNVPYPPLQAHPVNSYFPGASQVTGGYDMPPVNDANCYTQLMSSNNLTMNEYDNKNNVNANNSVQQL